MNNLKRFFNSLFFSKQADIVKINQIKLNAISAKNLHRRGIWKYERINNTILVLTIVVPIVFIIALYVSKGTVYENEVNTISFALSITLIAVSVLSLIWKINDKITIHKLGMKNNIYIANECDNLSNLNQGELRWFLRYVSEMDNNDNDVFTNISDKTRKNVYREALKELSPSDISITCPACNSSPWKYKEGNCQLCGNTPTLI